MWFTRRKDTDASSVKDMPQDPPTAGPSRAKSQSRPPVSRSGSIWITKKAAVEEPEAIPEPPTKGKSATRPNRPARSASVSGFWPGKTGQDDKTVPQRPGHQKARSDTAIVMSTKRSGSRTPSPARSHGDSGEGKPFPLFGGSRIVVETSPSVVTTKAEAPAWLLNAATALEYITSEHPKAMSIISAILITAGSIPAIPAIASGAGGVVLASGAAHAIGAIAVGVGQALGAGVKNAQKRTEGGVAAIESGSHH